jgi:hypothetical protein
MADNLDPMRDVPVVVDIDVLQEEEATLHPLIPDLSLDPALQIPGAHQAIQLAHGRARLRNMGLGIGCHWACSLKKRNRQGREGHEGVGSG